MMNKERFMAMIRNTKAASIDCSLAIAWLASESLAGDASNVAGMTADDVRAALAAAYIPRDAGMPDAKYAATFKAWLRDRRYTAMGWNVEESGNVPSLPAGTVGASFSSYVVTGKAFVTAAKDLIKMEAAAGRHISLAAAIAACRADWMESDEHMADFQSMAARALRAKYFSEAGKASNGKAADGDGDGKPVGGDVLTMDDEQRAALVGDIGVLFAAITTDGQLASLKNVAGALGLADALADMITARVERARREAQEAERERERERERREAAERDARKAAAALEQARLAVELSGGKMDELAGRLAELEEAARDGSITVDGLSEYANTRRAFDECKRDHEMNLARRADAETRAARTAALVDELAAA